MSAPAPAVVAEALTRRFGELVAVDQVSFTVAPGELFGIVGPDGAGKTTTLRMLAGVLRPTSGDARILGTSVARDPEVVKGDLAYMSQRFGLYADLTVLENLNFYADLYLVPKRERAARLERLFQFSNLRPFQDRLAGQLSGGMKQKLGLSCALIHQPKILLLDEPTFGVDPISRRDLWLIVHDMVAEGVTVIASTAYLDEAERFDRLILLHRGKILTQGTPEMLRTEIQGELWEIHVDRPREAERFLRKVDGVARAALFGERIHLTVTARGAAPAAIEAALREAGFVVHSTAALEPSLEDVFLDRVGTTS